MSEERMIILEMLKEGKISVEEAEKLLSAIGEDKDTGSFKKETSAHTESKKAKTDPWSELGEVWEKFGSDMEQFWSSFGETLHANIGQKWAKKMENWAENFRDSLKHASHDWSNLAGEAARQFFDSVGVEPDVIIHFDSGKEKIEDDWHWEQKCEDLETLVVNNIKGSIAIEGTDDNEVSIEAHKVVKATTKEKGETILSSIVVDPEFKDGILTIIPISQDNDRIHAHHYVRIDFSIKVPKSVNLMLNQIKGSVYSENITGDIKCSVKRGDIALRDVHGSQQLHTIKGDVSIAQSSGAVASQITKGDCSIKEHEGDCVINIMKGDFSATDLRGDVKSRTSLGDVAIKEYEGNATIATSKGDIAFQTRNSQKLDFITNHGDQSVTLSPLKDGSYSFVLHYGDLDLNLDGELSAEFNAQIMHGDIDSNILEAGSDRPPHSLKKTVGNGEAKVKITMMKGDLSLNAENDYTSGTQENSEENSNEETDDSESENHSSESDNDEIVDEQDNEEIEEK